MKKIFYMIHFRLVRIKNKLLFRLVYQKTLSHLSQFFPFMKIQNYSKHSLLFLEKEVPQEILSRSEFLNSDSLVIDVGGDVGIWSMQVNNKYRPRLLVFEPNPKSIDILKQNLKDVNVIILPYGLSGKNETMQLSLSGMGSSVFAESPDYTGGQKVDITLRDVKEVFEELKIGSVDLIKINIEGGEYNLLARMIDTSVISLCKIVRVQFHEWFTDAYALRKEIRTQLSRTHVIEWNYPFVWESWIRKDIQKS